MFFGLAPTWMCLGLAVIVTLLSIERALWWIRHRNDVMSTESATRILNRATRLLCLAAVVLASIDLIFYSYGDYNARMMLDFVFLSSAISSFFCLMQLRLAAITVALISVSPLVGLLVLRNTGGAWAVVCHIIVVIVMMVVVLQSYFQDFTNLVESKAVMVAQRAETERLSEQNLRLANLDMLTDLPNRRCFFADLDRKRAPAAATGRGLAVGILDLDGFKPINDLHGHGVGDRMLRGVAERLRTLVDARTAVYRLGGDEFAFIVEAPDSDAILSDLGHRSIEAIRQPFVLGDVVAAVGCSIGFATRAEPGETSDLLYDRADYALYQAKRTGRSRVVLFAPEHAQSIKTQSVVEAALRGADLVEEFRLVFQPIVDLTSGQTAAFECLARWRSPTLGEVAPSAFIVVAERIGMIKSLTSVLLRKALDVAVTWPAPIRMSFNLSAHDIASASQIQAFIDMIRTSGFDPCRIDMELTETALTCNFDVALDHMSMLRSAGMRVSLDDFGTGYSSISHIHALPIDKIKIDRSFVKNVGLDVNSLKIIKSLSALCSDMGLDCTVEGVETAEQVRLIASLGCDMMQGYYFARPMPADKIDAYMRQERENARNGAREEAA